MDATTSFVMALVAVVLTAINITVTYLLFRQAAGRVTVDMNSALLNPRRSLLVNERGTLILDTQDYGTTGVELAKVVIENPGRIAATITNVSLRFEGSKDADLEIPASIVPMKRFESTTGLDRIPHRLEPFDQVVYMVDFWEAVNHVFKHEPRLRQVNVWASVKVAGQSTPYDSKDHGYWTIQRSWVSVIPPLTERTAESIILAALMNVFSEPAENLYLVELARHLEEQIDPRSTTWDITAALQQSLGPGGDFSSHIMGEYNVLSFVKFGSEVKQRLDVMGPNVIWSVKADGQASTADESLT